MRFMCSEGQALSGATINELARRAGVSRATVARIVNTDVQYNRPAFARRAEKIRRLASQMGYRPNAAAKAMSTGRFQNIGLLMGVHYERSNFTRELLRGIHDVLHHHDFHLTINFLTDEQLEDEQNLPRFVREQMVDGLLLNYTHDIPQHMQHAIERAGLPVVWVNVKRASGCVYPDDTDAGRQAVTFLTQLGHRRIAFADFLHGPGNSFQPHYSVVDRLKGYAAAMIDAGLKPQVIEVPQLLAGPEAVRTAVAVLHQQDRPTAVVCQSPRDASVFEVAAARVGLDIPADLSLIVFGGERQNNAVTDPTLLVEPREAMGRAAAQALLQCLDHPEQPCPSRKVPYTLQSGQTTSHLKFSNLPTGGHRP